MKQFFKIMFACVLGVFIAGFLGCLIMFFAIIGMAATSTTTYSPESNTVFTLNLNSQVVEKTSTDPMLEIISTLNNEKPALALNDILKAIEIAKNDKNISGIYLRTDGYSASYATSKAIRRKLENFKESGKFIISYNDFYTQNQYYISTVSDSIFLNPMGAISFSGLSSTFMFFKNALDKLGVDVQVFRVGTFKSAVEPYILDKMSDANRKQVSVYMNSIWNTILSDISISKGISIDSLNSIADKGVDFMDTESIMETGLITGLKYKEEMDSVFIKKIGVEKLKKASLSDILSIKQSTKDSKNKIAILYASGEILSSNSPEGIFWENTISDIRKIKKDKDVKALVFRVNSPGGSAYASEQIWSAIEDLKKTMPVVVSMGDYAASGGYYISCNANYIVAEPTTLTGSIGVFGVLPNASKLVTDKIGITFDEVKTNKFGDISVFQPITETEGALIQKSVEHTYSIFKKRCADGRNLPVDSIATIAEGRVWTGENAYNLGLVDELGGIDKAISKAKELACITDYSIVEYPKEKEFVEILLEELSGNTVTKIKQQIIGEEYKYLKIVDYLRSLDKVQARMEPVIIK